MNNMIFLGTAGARFVVMKQRRSSGGIWLTLEKKNILIDPGPGALVRCISSPLRLDPINLDGIILTHRHLDHVADVNIMIEAMTQGGIKKRGSLFAPADALDSDPVVLQYLRHFVNDIIILKEGGQYRVGNVLIETPLRHFHGVETYGLRLLLPTGLTISFVTDTRYFPQLEKVYQTDVIVLNVVLYKRTGDHAIDHLCIEDAEKIFSETHPRLGILTHFGTMMLDENPLKVAKKMTKKLKIPIVAAQDGMVIKLDKFV